MGSVSLIWGSAWHGQCPFVPDIVDIRKDERLFELDAARNDILDVFLAVLVVVLELGRRLEQELFVVYRGPRGSTSTPPSPRGLCIARHDDSPVN
mgnify:CR=1 FL=1